MKKNLLYSTFILLSQIISAQFSESFEGSSLLPTGWTVLAGGDSGETWEKSDFQNSYGLQAQNGVKAFSIFYGSTAHNDYLVTPQFTVVAGVSDYLSFWARSRDSNYPETISVKYSTSTATVSAFTATLIPSVAPQSGPNFSKYQIDLSSLVGQTIYIGFHSATTDQFVFDLDNVVVSTLATCSEPTSTIAFANITTNSVSMFWGAPQNPPASGYEIYYSTSSLAPQNSSVATTTSTTTTISVDQLTPGTKYFFYVRSKCSETSRSVWGRLGVVQTKFTPVNPIYINNFDNTTAFQTEGWTGDFSLINQNPTLAQSGTNFCTISNSSTGVSNRWLYTIGMNLQANVTYTIKFYLRTFSQSTVPAQSLKLTVGNDQSDPSQTTTLWTTNTFNSTVWQEQVVTYTPTVTGVKYFGFNLFSPQQTVTVTLGLDTFSVSPPLGVEEFVNNKITVFPNPVSDILNIVSSSELVDEVTIIDINGRSVKTIENNTNKLQISIGDLTSGVYFLKIISAGNVTTEKIIKQ